MAYEINPCTACWMKYQRGDCDINSLNNCLVSTAGAFSQFPSTNSIRGTAAQDNWTQCINDKMTQIGRTPCDFQLNMAPVFVQVPHYFPSLMAQLGDKDLALKKAIEACSKSTYPAECKINCQTDYDAVIMMKPSVKPSVKPSAKPPYTKESYSESPSPGDFPTYNQIAKGKPIVFWIAFSLMALLLAYSLVIFIIILMKPKL